jgi:hypothetical protein
LEEIFWRNILGRFFLGGFFWEDFLGGILWRNYLVEINKVLMFLSRFWGNARRRKEEFRPLEVRGKLIALKNTSKVALDFSYTFTKMLHVSQCSFLHYTHPKILPFEGKNHIVMSESGSKKPGQNAVVYHFCDLSRFFLAQRL